MCLDSMPAHIALVSTQQMQKSLDLTDSPQSSTDTQTDKLNVRCHQRMSDKHVCPTVLTSSRDAPIPVSGIKQILCSYTHTCTHQNSLIPHTDTTAWQQCTKLSLAHLKIFKETVKKISFYRSCSFSFCRKRNVPH